MKILNCLMAGILAAVLFMITPVIPVYAESTEHVEKQESDLVLEEETGLSSEDETDMLSEEKDSEIEMIENTSFVHINPIYKDVFTEADIRDYTDDVSSIDLLSEADYFTTEQQVIDYVRMGMESRSNQITVYYLTESDLADDWLDILIDNVMVETGVPTQGDYLLLHYKKASCSMGGYIKNNTYYYTINFDVNYHTTYEQEEAVTSKVESVLDGFAFDSSTSNYEKVKTIYDWVCSNVTYDYDNLYDTAYTLKYTTYAALINGSSVCQGYASLMYRMLRESGILTRVIRGTSSGENHGWNIVRLGGLYYNLDATWDAGSDVYNYFLKCDKTFTDHARWDEYASETFYAAYPMAGSDYNSEDAAENCTIKDSHVSLEYTEHFYTGKTLHPVVTVYVGGITLKEDVDYTVTYSGDCIKSTVNANESPKVTVEGKGDWTGTVSKNFEITRADITEKEITLSQDVYIYDGSEKKPEVVVEGLELGVDYEVAYSNNTEAGTGTVIIKGIGNYTGEIRCTFEITRADITEKEMTLSQDVYIYDGSEKKPEVVIEGLELGVDYEVAYSNNTEAGTGTVKVTGINNYQGQKDLDFSINEQSINGYNFWLESSSVPYDGSEKKPKVLNDGNYVEDTDYIVSYSNNTEAGTGTVNIKGIGNYTGEICCMFEITRADITEKEIKLSQDVYIYDGSEKKPEVVIEGLELGVDYEVAYSNNVEVGTAAVTITGSGNYQGQKVLEFVIAEAVEEHLSFTDVPQGKWFYNAVKWAYTNGLLTGTSETTFSPNDSMTRGMLVTVLYRKEGRPIVIENNKFPDVNSKKYYASAITWASSEGLVSGYSNGDFGPEDSITREQLAKVLFLYAKYKGYDVTASADLSGFSDASRVSSYAKKYIQWTVAEGLIQGSNGKLNPQGNATRAEISAILKRFVEKHP